MTPHEVWKVLDESGGSLNARQIAARWAGVTNDEVKQGAIPPIERALDLLTEHRLVRKGGRRWKALPYPADSRERAALMRKVSVEWKQRRDVDVSTDR